MAEIRSTEVFSDCIIDAEEMTITEYDVDEDAVRVYDLHDIIARYHDVPLTHLVFETNTESPKGRGYAD